MSKQRVHELAKEFGKTNKDVMDFLKSKNIDVKSHMSTFLFWRAHHLLLQLRP